MAAATGTAADDREASAQQCRSDDSRAANETSHLAHLPATRDDGQPVSRADSHQAPWYESPTTSAAAPSKKNAAQLAQAAIWRSRARMWAPEAQTK